MEVFLFSVGVLVMSPLAIDDGAVGRIGEIRGKG